MTAKIEADLTSAIAEFKAKYSNDSPKWWASPANSGALQRTDVQLARTSER